jgi:hypothetical protein
MDRRVKILLILAGVTAGVLIFDLAFFGPWKEAWDNAGKDLQNVEFKLQEARNTLARERTVRKRWDEVKRLLARPRKPDAQTHFVTHLRQLADRSGASFDYQWSTRTQGDFKEYVYATTFKLKWEQFVDLLRELHNSKEFIRPLRIGVASLYEREDRLDLSMKVSTIEYAPVPPKKGANR